MNSAGGEQKSPVRVGLQELIDLRRAAQSLVGKRRRVRAATAGAYSSSFRGRGMEFDETRPYIAGDDIRTLDWKVTARTNKPHTKLYREERERPVQVCVDLRSNMFFATRGVFKAVMCSRLAAILVWRALLHRDRVGGFLFSDHYHDEIKPRGGKSAVLQYLRRLASNPAWDDALRSQQPPHQETLNQALTRLRRVARPGSLIFVLSDFRGLDRVGESHLHELARRNEIVLVFCYDEFERRLPMPGLYSVTDGRHSVVFDNFNNRAGRRYEARFAAHFKRLELLGNVAGIFLLHCTTAEKPLAVLQAGLGRNFLLCRT